MKKKFELFTECARTRQVQEKKVYLERTTSRMHQSFAGPITVDLAMLIVPPAVINGGVVGLVLGGT